MNQKGKQATRAYSERRSQFQIQIRKRKNQDRIAAMRAELFTYSTTDNQSNEQAQRIIEDAQKAESLVPYLPRLKVISYNADCTMHMDSFLEELQKIIQQTRKTEQFEDAITIVINYSAEHQLVFSQQFVNKIVRMILRPQRELIVYWFLTNILLRRNQQARELMQLLIKIDVIEYIENRIKAKFQDKSQLTTFNNFCCSLLSNCELLQHQKYKSLLSTLHAVQSYELDDTDYFLSLSMIDQAPYISYHNYQLLTNPLFKKFFEHCKNKKSKLIKNYLELILTFIKSDFDTDFEKKNYQRMQKYGIFSSLMFCIQNRSPDVKRLLAQIGSTLIANFQQKIDLLNEDFYLMLGMQVKNLGKFQQNVQMALLLFIEKLILVSIERKGQDQLMLIMQKAQIGNNLVSIVKDQRQLATSIILRIFNMILPISVQIKRQCQSEGLLLALEGHQFKNPDVKRQVLNFLEEYN